MIKAPTITIDGKEYKAKARGKVWRKFLALQNSQNAQDSEEGLNEIYELYVVAFNDPAITVESIDDNIELEQIYGLFYELGMWIKSIMLSKVEKFPNAESPAKE